MIILGIDMAQYPYLNALLMGLIWSIYGYFTSTTATTFKVIKLAATLVTSAFTVTLLYMAGVPIDKATFEQQMVLFGFVTIAAERLFTKIADYFDKKPAVQTFLQGTTDPAIKFSLQYLGSRITPCDVMFTAISEGITKWSYGDGVFASFDTPGQKTIVHTYKIPGTFQVRAFVGAVMSEPMEVTILGSTPPGPGPQPVKKSWLAILLAWFSGLFGKK